MLQHASSLPVGCFDTGENEPPKCLKKKMRSFLDPHVKFDVFGSPSQLSQKFHVSAGDSTPDEPLLELFSEIASFDYRDCIFSLTKSVLDDTIAAKSAVTGRSFAKPTSSSTKSISLRN